MKKIISLIIAAMLIMACFTVSFSAADGAKTSVKVNEGDSVTYKLAVEVPEKIVGCDFSVYYDESLLKVDSIADYTDSTNEDDWNAVINYNLDGEVRGNWSVLNGIDFTSRKNIVTVNFKALKAGETHISYYVRYMYNYDLVEFTEYSFTCDVLVNGEAVIETSAPELNVEAPQTSGEFMNSLEGDGSSADVNTYEKPVSGSNGAEPKEGEDATSGDSDNAETDDNSADKATEASTEAATIDADAEISTDSDGNLLVKEVTPATGNDAEAKGPSIALWIIIAILVVGAGCAVIYFTKKKKASDNQ